MNKKLSILSYVLAAVSGICFVGGLIIISE